MKFLIPIVFWMLLVAGCASLSRPSSPVPSLVVPAGEWTFCQPDEAEFTVKISYQLRDASGPEERIVHFRKQRPPQLKEKRADGTEVWTLDMNTRQSWSAYADGQTEDGKGIGSAHSIEFYSTREGFTMTVDYSWDTPVRWNDSVVSGKLKKSWVFRQLTDIGIQVSAGPFHARVSVEKI